MLRQLMLTDAQVRAPVDGGEEFGDRGFVLLLLLLINDALLVKDEQLAEQAQLLPMIARPLIRIAISGDRHVQQQRGRTRALLGGQRQERLLAGHGQRKQAAFDEAASLQWVHADLQCTAG